jgi:hypothetical protein
MQLVAGDVTRELGDKARELVEERFGHRNYTDSEDVVDASGITRLADAAAARLFRMGL